MRLSRSPAVPHIARLLLAPAAGVGLAASLEGPWWGVFAPAALVPVLGLVRSAPRGIFFMGTLLFAAPFYAWGLRGLLGIWGGAFAEVWFGLTIAFTVLHLSLFSLLRPIIVTYRNQCWWVFPVAFTAFEYARHLATAAYDGNGLTFLTAGQALAGMRLVRQVADLGGMWFLSGVVALAAAILSDLLDAKTPGRQRTCRFLLLMGGVAMLLGYGWVRCNMYQPRTIGAAIIVTRPLSASIVEQIDDLAGRQEDRPDFHQGGDSGNSWIVILSPELSISWDETETRGPSRANQAGTLQQAMLHASHHDRVLAIIGAAIYAPSGAMRNSQLLLRAGEVKAVADKQHLVPFLEGRPLGTEFLEERGLIPEFLTSRWVEAGRPINRRKWSSLKPPLIPATCYDLFFSDSFRDCSWDDQAAIYCSLDESFDVSGVFQTLSVAHTRLRAVEFRRPVVRASLQGVSGVMNGNGEWATIVDPQTPVSTVEIPADARISFYARWGDWWPRLCLVAVLGLLGKCLVAHVRRLLKNPHPAH